MRESRAITLLYPVHNRVHLFRPTLEVFTQQRVRDLSWEILVVDDRSEDDLYDLCQQFGYHLPISYVRTDVRRIGADLWEHNGCINPAYVQNVGIKLACGDQIVFSSPEILHTSQDSVKALAAWPHEAHEAVIGDVWDDQFQQWISGGEMHRTLPFLCMYNRKRLIDINGVEEAFLDGTGFEDDDLTHRWLWSGGSFVFTGQVVTGFHQYHERVEQETRDGWDKSHARWLKYKHDGEFGQRTLANLEIGREWGSPEGIVETWQSDRWKEMAA